LISSRFFPLKCFYTHLQDSQGPQRARDQKERRGDYTVPNCKFDNLNGLYSPVPFFTQVFQWSPSFVAIKIKRKSQGGKERKWPVSA